MTYSAPSGPPPPGPLAEEAARLLEAVQEWTREHVGDAQVGHAAACKICPLCQVVAAVSRPETWSHLADAAASVAAALRSAVDSAAARPASPPAPDVEHIDISGE